MIKGESGLLIEKHCNHIKFSIFRSKFWKKNVLPNCRIVVNLQNGNHAGRSDPLQERSIHPENHLQAPCLCPGNFGHFRVDTQPLECLERTGKQKGVLQLCRLATVNHNPSKMWDHSVLLRTITPVSLDLNRLLVVSKKQNTQTTCVLREKLQGCWQSTLAFLR